MDLDEPIESLRDRAASSEPASSRPKPFDDDSSSSRKRQRMEFDDQDNSSATEPAELTAASPVNQPTTPTRMANLPTTPNSNRVTLNLRSTREAEPDPSSPHSPASPSKRSANTTTKMEKNTDSEADANELHQTIETPSSSLSSGEPEIMLVEPEQEYYSDANPPVTIIDDGDDVMISDGDPIWSFPFVDDHEQSFPDGAMRLARYFENGTMNAVNGPLNFNKFRAWVEQYIKWAHRFPDLAFISWKENSDFWECIHEVIKSLTFRKTRPHFGQWLKHDTAARESLSNLFTALACLTGVFVLMDLRTLERCNEHPEKPQVPLGSRMYLEAIWFLMQPNTEHVGLWLRQCYHWDWEEESHSMHRALAGYVSLPNFIRLANAYIEILPRHPRLVENLQEICRHVAQFLRMPAVVDGRNFAGPEFLYQVDLAYDFFETMEKHLCDFIEKNATSLNPDIVFGEISALTEILQRVLANVHNPSAAARLQQVVQSDPDLPSKLLPQAASIRWKLSMLTKLITSSQMQLRVGGVSHFCNELLQLYADRNGFLPADHPLMRNIAKYIVSIHIVEYIVGTCTHPEIIGHSRDMVGFLAITRTYTDYHTDKIWSTVKSSLDHRVVESILRLLLGVIALLDARDRMYICNKLQEIPVEGFTVAMRHFCEELLRLVCNDAVNKQMDLEAPPYELCVRLICQSTVPRADSPMAFNELQQWASNQFEFLTNRLNCIGPDTSVRLRIYDSCLDDLRSGETADGSLIALSILVQANLLDLKQLIDKADFIQLLIRNFSWRKTKNSISKHLRLFRHLIVKNYIKDTAGLGLKLWNKIIGAEEADIEGEERQGGWQMLSEVMKDARPENVFIRACIQQYLPNLPPHLFSKASFSFARQAIGCFSTGRVLESQDDILAIDQHGVEQLWRMVLSSNDRATFQNYAFNELISFYLDSPMINQLPLDKIQEIHLAFVNRCLEQLKSAAGKLKSFSEGTTSGDDEPMVIVAPDEEIHDQESLFCKSLLLLKGFLRAYDSNPRFAPKRSQPQRTNTSEGLKGEAQMVSYQVFSEKETTEVRKVEVGNLNSGAFLFGTLKKLAGCKHIRVHHKGKEVSASDVDLSKSLSELDLGMRGHLVLVTRISDPDLWNENAPVHLEVVKSFDDLFDLLSMDGTQAKDLYELLVWFPPYGKLYSALTSENVSYRELFPAQHPYKSLYAMRSLRTLLVNRTDVDQDDPSIKHRCFNLLVDTLASHEYLVSHTDDEFRFHFFMELLESLAYAFQDVVLRNAFESSADGEILLPRLMCLFAEAQKSSFSESTNLMFKTFSTILIMSTSSTLFWQKFKAHPGVAEAVQALLLGSSEDNRRDDGIQAANQIGQLCCGRLGFVNLLCQGNDSWYTDLFSHESSVDQTEFVQFFWPLLVRLVPKATSNPERCERFLNLVQQILGAALGISKATDVSIDCLDLGDLAREWAQLLISHEVVQYVGRPTVVDPVTLGLASLLKACIFSMEPMTVASLRPLAVELFNTHLFPDVTVPPSGAPLPLPVLDSATRKILVEIIEWLVSGDESSYAAVMKMTANLVPDPDDEDVYQVDVSHSYDRSREIRSPTGYVGLKNLSNTCYLNSLMSQLFMNVSFREFMMNAHVPELGAQKLLQQTKILFCDMQNSFRRYAEPANLAQSIKTYEELPIDVTIQMDVDEFYNLLFDRWEGQILADDDKAAFRSFYGGQLVQQVKSKECAHISERLEPFSAIQCDIKGKASLQESLQAYVDGEIMEGDNKYKCSTCDQHVDAVKRACLKDVPDNLIFHLKRFDYDLRENRRNKLNDYFSFPNDIDMRPYKVDYLTNGPEGSEEDVFELVGVLVHSGTAESGHYYSYIRERPSKDGKSWVEFNDDQVTPFDPSNIEASCFGGSNYQANEYQFDKSFSAYMLFYQRRSFLIEQERRLGHQLEVEPIKLPIPPSEAQTIDEDNALLMRIYALYDPSHAQFVKNILSFKQCGQETRYSEHALKSLALKVTFNHMDQVFGRTKDTPEFDELVSKLETTFAACSPCSEAFIAWLSAQPNACRYFLVKSPDTRVRSGISDLIVAALQTLKRDSPDVYGLSHDSRYRTLGSPQAVQGHNLGHGAFGRMVDAVCPLWDSVLLLLRAWPEYFDLLRRMMDGVHESALLMDNGAFFKTMEIITANYHADPSPEILRFLHLIGRRVKPVPFENVISLMDKFLEAFSSISVRDCGNDRPSRCEQYSQNLPLTLWPEESNRLTIFWTTGEDNILVGELIRRDMNDEATQSIIKQLVLKLEEPRPSLSLYNQISYAIIEGLKKQQSSNLPAPYLRGALTVCRYTPHRTIFMEMVAVIKKCVVDGDLFGGLSFLQFFKGIADLPDNRIGWSQLEMWCFSMRNLPSWAPALLVNYDSNVRGATEEYIQQTVLRYCDDTAISDAGGEDRVRYNICLETSQVLGMRCLEFLDKHFVRPNTQILKAHISSIKPICDACRLSYEDGSVHESRYGDLYQIVWSAMQRLAVTHLDEEGSVGSDEWEQSDAELSTSSVIGVEDTDIISLLDNATDL